jgi:hypothetical protein
LTFNNFQQHDLQQIEAPFTKEDIDNVVKKCPQIRLLGLMASMASSSKSVSTSSRRIYINSVLTSLKKE